MTEYADAFERVSRAVTDIAGGPDLLEVPITRECRFYDDLALESIDLVTLTAVLGEESDGVVNLAGRLAELTLDDVVDLTVGRLVDMVAADLGSARAA